MNLKVARWHGHKSLAGLAAPCDIILHLAFGPGATLSDCNFPVTGFDLLGFFAIEAASWFRVILFNFFQLYQIWYRIRQEMEWRRQWWSVKMLESRHAIYKYTGTVHILCYMLFFFLCGANCTCWNFQTELSLRLLGWIHWTNLAGSHGDWGSPHHRKGNRKACVDSTWSSGGERTFLWGPRLRLFFPQNGKSV